MRYKKSIISLSLILLATIPNIAVGQAMIALLFGGKLKNDNISLGLYLAAQSSYLTNTAGNNAYGLALGAYSNIKLSKRWELSNYITCKSPKGELKVPLDQGLVANADIPIESAIHRKIVYFEIIPFLRYHFTSSLSAAIGPQIGFRTVSKDLYKDKREDGSTQNTVYKTKDYIHRFDFGASADIQYALLKGNGIRFNLRFTPGLANIYKENANAKARNGYFQLGVGIPIGHKKATGE